jgi:preprotein translocase subunit SecA
LEFDDVLNHQRNHIYKKRRVYLGMEPVKPAVKETDDENQESDVQQKDPLNLKSEILNLVRDELTEIVEFNLNVVDENGNEQRDWDNLFKAVNTIIPVTTELQKKAKAEYENAADQDFAVADTFYKSAADIWEAREKELGKEIFEGAQRYVALQALDSLWMEHLDTMDHLRDSVRLRGYGQRDPLVEYKKEGYQMFQTLLKEINKQIVNSIFHISVNVQPQQQAQNLPNNLVTNLSDGSSASGNSSGGSNPSTDPKYAGVGRNDRCPSGSGKKFKKCHGK